MDYHCTISSMDEHQVIVSVNSSVPTISEPSVSVTLYQGLPKSDKMDSVVQKAVEMGVTRIVPMLTQRCVSRPDQKSAQKKVERWQKISVEAAKQCGRDDVPEVAPVMSFTELVDAYADTRFIIPYEQETAPLSEACHDVRTGDAVIAIGPEGGYAEKEIAYATQHLAWCRTVSLGPRILRAETASLAALSIIMYERGFK